MAQNITINKTVFIQNNYYVQAPPPQSNVRTFGWGVVTGFAGTALGLYVLKKNPKLRRFIASINRCVDNLFGDDDLRNELNKARLSAKRNNCANTNHSTNVNSSKSTNHNYSVNTNYSPNNNHSVNNINTYADNAENNKRNNTDVKASAATEEVKYNQQQAQFKADSFKNEKTECSKVVESSNESAVSSPVQEKEANLDEQYTADIKCSPEEKQKNGASTRQKKRSKAVKKTARGAILYNPLLLPDLIRGFEADLQKTALKVLYGLCQNKLFQCSESGFLYWFGGESDTPHRTYQRISWQKSNLALQYFMKQLYNERFDKGQWEMVANVFKIKGKTIPVGGLGKNTSNVGDKDKQMIDDLIKQFKKEAKKIVSSSIK